jgi:hypothetical protein
VHVVLVAAAEARSFLATHPTRRADELVNLVFVLYLPLDPSRLRSAVWAASRVVVGGDAAGRRGVHVRAASATWIAVATAAPVARIAVITMAVVHPHLRLYLWLLLLPLDLRTATSAATTVTATVLVGERVDCSAREQQTADGQNRH